MPPVPTKSRKRGRITVRPGFTSEEFDRISQHARETGQKVSRFIRNAALGGAGASNPLLHEIALVGRALDRIARLLATTTTPELLTEVCAALERHKALVEHFVKRREGPDEDQ